MNFLKKQWHWILAILILTVIALSWILFGMSDGARSYWFDTGEGNFQWAGISAIITAISVLVVVITFSINSKFDREKFDTNLKESKNQFKAQLNESRKQFSEQLNDSKKLEATKLKVASRVQWLNEVRPILSEFIVAGRNSINDKFNSSYPVEEDERQYRRATKANETMAVFRQNYNLLLMYIPETIDNEKILKVISELYEFTNGTVREIVENDTSRSKLDISNSKVEKISEYSMYSGKLLKESGSYFKDEWERIKNFE